jgi:RNA polymerase sigma factor (sigma-70 family)
MRHVKVVHDLQERNNKGKLEVLLAPHAGWGERGCRVLAARTMKVHGSVEQTLRLLREETFGGTPPAPSVQYRLGAYTVVAHSPTAGEWTKYEVHPFVARYAPGARPALPASQWLTRQQALPLAELSPTLPGLLSQSPSAAPGSLEERLLRARERDRAALGGILLELAGCMRLYAARWLSSPQDQEDAVGSAIVQAIQHIDTFVPVMTAQAWLCGIVRGQALDMLRRQKTRRADSLDGFEEALPLAGRGPVEEAESVEGVAAIRAAVRRVLSRHDWRTRVLWRSHIDEGLGYDEIMPLLDIPYAAATRAVFRIRKQLREELGGQRA